MIIKVNGIELFYEVTGQGQPLLLVHGNGEDHHIFDDLVNILKDQFTCYCIDSRGHGQSSLVDTYSYQAMAEDIIELINILELKNVVYYGFSDGGIIGLLIASQSKLLDYLIVSGANTNPQGLKMTVYYLMKVMNYFKKDPKIKMMLEQPHINNQQLNTIKAKTMVLAGSNDVVKESHTINIAHHINACKLNILAGENHSSYIINSTKLAPIILSFIKGN